MILTFLPHLKDPNHICLEPEGQWCGMTFRFILRWSNYPLKMVISRNITSYNYRKEWYVKDCCFYELILFKYGRNKICTNIHVFWIYFMGIYANIGFQSALIHRPHDGHLDFFLHVQKYSSPWVIPPNLWILGGRIIGDREFGNRELGCYFTSKKPIWGFSATK